MNKQIPDDSILVRNARLAVKRELEKRKALGLPISEYDPKTEKVYIVYPDGTREEAGGRILRGSYSERCK
ncbi:MAG: hypothetical protein LUI06_08385 [Ruminococcus sp.]|nr:hypothetical protein [Ruminococcus sp.]